MKTSAFLCRYIATAEGFGKEALDAVTSRLSLKHCKAVWVQLSAQDQEAISFGPELTHQQLLISAVQFLEKRCRFLVSEFRTSIPEDRKLMAEGGLCPNKRLSIAFQLRKKLLLSHILLRLEELKQSQASATSGAS